MDLLAQVKMLLGIADIDTSKDGVINFLITRVSADVKKFCRISDVSSDELQALIADMVVTRYRARGYGKETAPQVLSSIAEGDVTLQFKTTQYNATSELTDAEKSALVPYRKLWP